MPIYPGMKARLPEIEISGGGAFQHHLPDLARKVEYGKIVRLVDLRTGRHRGWFTRESPEGCEPVRVTVYQLGRTMGTILDEVRSGQVFQVWNARSCRVVGYIAWCPPEWLALLADMPFAYVFRTRSGGVIRREMRPLAVEAEPSPAPWKRAGPPPDRRAVAYA
jgi:hypothetical protein